MIAPAKINFSSIFSNSNSNMMIRKTILCSIAPKLIIGLLIYSKSFAQQTFIPKENQGKWGYINEKGEPIIPYQYDWAGLFNHSAACVKLGGKFGLINKDNAILLASNYDTLFNRPGAVVFIENGLFGIMDTLGNRITKAIYQRVEGGANKSLNVKKDGQWFNWRDGNEIAEELGNLIFTTFDEGGLFPGCKEETDIDSLKKCSHKKLLQFIYQNIKYPFEAREAEVSGLVHIGFTIDKQGKIGNIEIKKDPGTGLGEEARRVVAKMPNWVPAKVEGEIVQINFIQPIWYKLD